MESTIHPVRIGIALPQTFRLNPFLYLDCYPCYNPQYVVEWLRTCALVSVCLNQSPDSMPCQLRDLGIGINCLSLGLFTFSVGIMIGSLSQSVVKITCAHTQKELSIILTIIMIPILWTVICCYLPYLNSISSSMIWG